ncbi:MAG: hypothetical protein AAGG11_20105 [Pseudomonadota bacterium]
MGKVVRNSVCSIGLALLASGQASADMIWKSKSGMEFSMFAVTDEAAFRSSGASEMDLHLTSGLGQPALSSGPTPIILPSSGTAVARTVPALDLGGPAPDATGTISPVVVTPGLAALPEAATAPELVVTLPLPDAEVSCPRQTTL